MPSRHRDKRRIGLGQAIYALAVIVAIPTVVLIEVRTLRLAQSIRRTPVLEFPQDIRPNFRPMPPHGPNMDIPAIIRPRLEVKPLKR